MNYKIYFDPYFNESLTYSIYKLGCIGDAAEEMFQDVKGFCLNFEQFPNRMTSANVVPDSLKCTWFENKNNTVLFYLAAVVDDQKKEVTFIAAGGANYGREALIKEVVRSV